MVMGKENDSTVAHHHCASAFGPPPASSTNISIAGVLVGDVQQARLLNPVFGELYQRKPGTCTGFFLWSTNQSTEFHRAVITWRDSTSVLHIVGHQAT